MKIKGKEINWKFIEKAGRFVQENGSTLSMVGGILLLGGAIYAAFKASGEVVRIQEKYDSELKEMKSGASEEGISKEDLKSLKTERNIHYILAYKWVILLGGSSAGLIFLTKYLDGLAISGLTAVCVSQQDKIKSLIDRTREVVGEEKYQEIEEKTFDDLVTQNFMREGQPLAIKPVGGAGDIFIDTDTGAMFQMRRSDLEEAIKLGESYYARNHEIYRDKWWSMLGFEPPTGSRSKCWGPKNPFSAHIGTRNTHGITVQTIEYDYIPQMPEHAGILKRKY